MTSLLAALVLCIGANKLDPWIVATVQPPPAVAVLKNETCLVWFIRKGMSSEEVDKVLRGLPSSTWSSGGASIDVYPAYHLAIWYDRHRKVRTVKLLGDGR
jgi:hypothetical protein